MRQAWRLLALLALCCIALQTYFVVRIALMAVLDPQSTAFQRREIWRLLAQTGRVAWGQQWVDDLSPGVSGTTSHLIDNVRGILP